MLLLLILLAVGYLLLAVGFLRFDEGEAVERRGAIAVKPEEWRGNGC